MKPKKPKPDPQIAKNLAAEQKAAEEERKALEAQEAEEESARGRGLRGARALLAGSRLGFGRNLLGG